MPQGNHILATCEVFSERPRKIANEQNIRRINWEGENAHQKGGYSLMWAGGTKRTEVANAITLPQCTVPSDFDGLGIVKRTIAFARRAARDALALLHSDGPGTSYGICDRHDPRGNRE